MPVASHLLEGVIAESHIPFRVQSAKALEDGIQHELELSLGHILKGSRQLGYGHGLGLHTLLQVSIGRKDASP
jgi:hypothetical protein